MAPVFIFIEDIQKALDSDKKEIMIPRETRISAAAFDLIKGNDIRIRFVGDQKDDALKAPVDPTQETQASPAVGRISDGELEKVVDLVISRIKGAKSQESSETVKKENGPTDDDLVICRCEEITKGEIKEVIKNGIKTPNGIKRITRAGMGLCQGQTCQRLVTQILATGLGINPTEIKPTTGRAPVRPVSFSAFSTG
ncbi:MAG: (2Fe-2S)-binding protein [Desulfobacterales bacterium]|nr:(2Fe-2S)-binding protein [Desulfobacterales bacterium]MDP6681726.1 (2Fe-2S)-binding protein [Desulfobacterales bacterium]MDP6807461.1 (2Fe-2S)-binding protein [Desulfobacterales bacterium]